MIAKSLIQNYPSSFHSLAMRRAKSWIEAMNSHAVADAMVCSKSLARRRLRLSHCQRSFDDPASWQDDKSLCGIGPFDDLDGPFADLPEGGPELVARITAIGEDMAQPRETADDFSQHQWRTVAVLDTGGVDHGVDQIALGVGQDVALTALDLLARIIAARTAGFSIFDTLAVDQPGNG